jgi:hypothetical protein
MVRGRYAEERFECLVLVQFSKRPAALGRSMNSAERFTQRTSEKLAEAATELIDNVEGPFHNRNAVAFATKLRK